MSVLADLHARGKVRDIYQVEDDRLLMVTSDRISAFDVVLPNPIPDKGRVLTGLSLFWFERVKELVPNHLISAAVDDFPAEYSEHRDELAGRSMLVKRAEMFPIECVARGFLSGSGWKEYRESGTVCGIGLPSGLVESDRLPEPIFTPATKAETGHDENISFERASDIVGEGLANRLKELTLSLYELGAEVARERGVILADTKFEFGFIDGEIALCDEVMTPDSSRFWPLDEYSPGGSQPSFDKQYVRDWLDESGWNHEPPPPELPADVVGQTAARYREAYERITGQPFDSYLRGHGVL
ncbi:MAG: phosphoribosylaminoimidazolesuccinocarboxamide synthase [Actinomycetota bacterium]